MAGSAAASHPRAWAGADLAEAAAAVAPVVDEPAPRRRRDLRRDGRLRASGPRAHPRGDLPRGRRVGRRARAVCRAHAPVVGRRGPLLARPSTSRPGVASSSPASTTRSRRRSCPTRSSRTRVVDPSVVPVQVRALRFHETQVVVGDGWYALSNHVVSRLAGREGYARLDAATGRPVSEGEQCDRRVARPRPLPPGDGPARRRRQRPHDGRRGTRPRHDGRHPHLGLARPAPRARVRRVRDPVARRGDRGGSVRGERARRRPAAACRSGSPPAGGRCTASSTGPPTTGASTRAWRCSTARSCISNAGRPTSTRPGTMRSSSPRSSPSHCPTPWGRPWSTSEDATGASHDDLESLYDHTEWEEPAPARPAPLAAGRGCRAPRAPRPLRGRRRVARRPGPRGTTVAGVAVGGMSRDEARATLTAAASGSVPREPLVLASTAGEVETTAKDLGLAVDVDASARRPRGVLAVTGRHVAPPGRWRGRAGRGHRRRGGRSRPPLEKARGELDAEPVEGSISVAKGQGHA